MSIPFDLTPTDLQSFVNGEIDTSISYDDVASLGESRYGRGDSSEALRVDDGGFCTEESGYFLFYLRVDV